MKPGRNDPCPCGSGRKFKHCCGGIGAAPPGPPESLAWRRLRRLLEEHSPDLHRFTLKAYGPESVLEAWEEFTGFPDEVPEFDPESPHIGLFLSWFHNFWSPDPNDPDTSVRDVALHEVVPVRAYLDRRGPRLDPLLREYCESCLEAPLAFHEVVESDPGRGFVLKELITGTSHSVAERSASAGAQVGDVVLAQVVHAGGLSLIECCSPFALPPIFRIEIARRCKVLVGRRKRAAFPLREHDFEMLEIYQDVAAPLLEHRLPALHNTDGDPFSLRKLVYAIDSVQQAFDALRHLDPASDLELEQDLRRDADGRLAEARLTWVGATSSRQSGMSNAVLATLTLSAGRLSAEVNSEAREKRLREIVEQALGSAARYRATEIQTVEAALEEARSRPGDREAEERDAELAESPEVVALMNEHLSRHYERWVNERIPALGERTPMNAIKTREGREAVAALVAQIERDGSRMKPPLDPAIVRRLRERLGLGPGRGRTNPA